MANLEELSQVFKALSDPLRLRLLKLLTKQNRCKEFCVGGLAEELGISQPNVSHHLKILKSVGLIKCQKYDGYSYYVVNMDRLEVLLPELKDKLLSASCSGRGGIL